MQILIFGASGRTGQELVKQALALGHNVMAFVRNPAKLSITHDNLEIFQGDIVDYQMVDAAVKGQDAVLSALGASSPFKFDKPVVDGMINIIKAMENNNVSRLIYLSAIIVKESRKYAGVLGRLLSPVLLRNEIAGHEAREQLIKRSRLDWTIVRPAKFSDNGSKTDYRSGLNIRANGITDNISRDDTADFMIRQLNDPTFIRNTPIVMY